jgi:hypothetical protein
MENKGSIGCTTLLVIILSVALIAVFGTLFFVSSVGPDSINNSSSSVSSVVSNTSSNAVSNSSSSVVQTEPTVNGYIIPAPTPTPDLIGGRVPQAGPGTDLYRSNGNWIKDFFHRLLDGLSNPR